MTDKSPLVMIVMADWLIDWLIDLKLDNMSFRQ